MIQPVAKLQFVERYCNPKAGWKVFVDIDPSEEGRTGSARKTDEAKARQQEMLQKAPEVIEKLNKLKVYVGKRKRHWEEQFAEVPLPQGDRDILAVHSSRAIIWVVEIEGDSSGQPEGKIYRALGQLVCAVSETQMLNFDRFFSLVLRSRNKSAILLRFLPLQ
jgi:hypothetical protein